MWTLISFALSLLAVVAAAEFGDIEIVGGSTIDISQAPYTISLRGVNGGHFCGGSIISNLHILTAAHCVYGMSASSLSINAGSTNKLTSGVLVQVSTMAIHPNYIGSANNFDHDVAVLKLAQQLPVSNSNIKIIPMASQGMQVPAGQTVLISGWGWTSAAPPPPPSSSRMENNETDEYSFSDVLKAVNLLVIDNQSCRTQLGITNNMMCAGGRGEASCSGDSGGPAASQGVLVGVVSWGVEGSCVQDGKPSVQASVGALRSWIDSQMN